MDLDLTHGRDPAFRLVSEDPALARAPARRFDITDRPDRTFFSHGVFAVLAMGFGSYFGNLRETLNPPPHAAQPDMGHRNADIGAEQGSGPQSVEPESLDLAAFWQSFVLQFDDVVTMAGRPRPHHSVLRYDLSDFQFSYPQAERAFSGAQVSSFGESIHFRFPPAVNSRPMIGTFIPEQGGPPPWTMPVSGDVSTGEVPPKGTKPTDPTTGEKVNRSPLSRGPVSLGIGLANLSILLSWADLAKAAVDPDGDALTISNIHATSGTVRAYGDHAWIFTPDHDKTGVVSFTYSLSDGKASVAGQAFVRLVEADPEEIAGSPGDDVLIGTPSDDLIDAGAGDDTVYSRDGDDHVLGGEGDDLLIGGAGDDVIDGGAGNDRIFGGDGKDILSGGAGNDQLWGEAGDDRLMGGDGSDVLAGGDGNDYAFGEDGDDVLSGDRGDDVLTGGDGCDTLAGGEGADVVIGDHGNDTYVAGTDPVLDPVSAFMQQSSGLFDALVGSGVLEASDGNDVVNGGEGVDCYDASRVSSSVVIDLLDGYAEGTAIGRDVLVSIEDAVGGDGEDTIVAGVMVNIMDGGAGQDVFVFESLDTLLNLGRGHDEIRRFEVGDKIDFSDLSKELGRFYFSDEDRAEAGDGSGEHFALVRFSQDLGSDDHDRQLVKIVTDIGGDEECELVVVSHHGLTIDDFILAGSEGVEQFDLFMA